MTTTIIVNDVIVVGQLARYVAFTKDCINLLELGQMVLVELLDGVLLLFSPRQVHLGVAASTKRSDWHELAPLVGIS